MLYRRAPRSPFNDSRISIGRSAIVYRKPGLLASTQPVPTLSGRAALSRRPRLDAVNACPGVWCVNQDRPASAPAPSSNIPATGIRSSSAAACANRLKVTAATSAVSPPLRDRSSSCRNRQLHGEVSQVQIGFLIHSYRRLQNQIQVYLRETANPGKGVGVL